jgi:hypothetical protein
VRPELVAEVKHLTWTDENLLRQVVYEGLREGKPAAEVRRRAPHLNGPGAVLPAGGAPCEIDDVGIGRTSPPKSSERV